MAAVVSIQGTRGALRPIVSPTLTNGLDVIQNPKAKSTSRKRVQDEPSGFASGTSSGIAIPEIKDFNRSSVSLLSPFR